MTKELFLPKDQARRIHETSLDVLENTGIRLLGDLSGEESVEEMLLGAGARKDAEERILLPRKLVGEALEKAPSGFTLYDRDGNKSLDVRNGNTFFGPGSDSLYNYNKATGRLFETDESEQANQSALKDVAENVRVADALDYDFIMSMALPRELGPKELYPVVFAEMVKNSNKPLVFTSTRKDELEHIQNLAEIVSEEVAEKPFHVAYLEPISPLKFDVTVLERMMFCAEHGIPVTFAAGANCGTGAPVTVEGGVIQGNAESLAGLVICTLKNEHMKFIYGANTSAIDMNTMIVCYGAPEWFKTVAMYADMGKFYNLPSWGTAGCTDARNINAQAGAEAYEGILMALLSGSTFVHDVAFLGHGEVYHAGMLVLAKTLIDRAKKLLDDPDVSERRLSDDAKAIDEVARANDLYLAHPHTMEHFRESLWFAPDYFERGRMEDWDANRLQARLLDEANAVLSAATPKTLTPAKLEKVESYLKTI